MEGLIAMLVGDAGTERPGMLSFGVVGVNTINPDGKLHFGGAGGGGA